MTSFSKNLATKCKFDTGLKFFNSSLSKFGLFNNGLIRADLNSLGKVPLDNELLNIASSNGSSSSMQHFSNHVGIGSNWHDELLQDLLTLRISAELVNLSSLNLMFVNGSSA